MLEEEDILISNIYEREKEWNKDCVIVDYQLPIIGHEIHQQIKMSGITKDNIT